MIHQNNANSYQLIAQFPSAKQNQTHFQGSTSSMLIRYTKPFNRLAFEFEIYFEQVPQLVKCSNGKLSCDNGIKCYDQSAKCNGRDDCGDGTDEQACSLNSFNFTKPCGTSHSATSERIVGGNVAKPGEWPWAVSLRSAVDEPNGHFCGAVILNRYWIATAGHCIKQDKYPLSNVTIHVGKYHKLIKDASELTRRIGQVHVHPSYLGYNDSEEETFQDKLNWLKHNVNDIALIRLDAPLPLNDDYINAVCLSTEYIDTSRTATVIGWGSTQYTGHDNVLKQLTVPIVPLKTCNSWQPDYNVNGSMICAGYETGGQDSCYVSQPSNGKQLITQFDFHF